VKGISWGHSMIREEIAVKSLGQQPKSSRIWVIVSMCSIQAGANLAAEQPKICVESLGEGQHGHLSLSGSLQALAAAPTLPLFSEPCLVLQCCLPAVRAFMRTATAFQSNKGAASGSK
jgi:hypothetical protein